MKEAIIPFDAGREFYTPEGCYIIELSNTPDDPEVSIARARVKPGVTTRWHRLSGITERYVILKGTGRVYLDGHTEKDVGCGDVVHVPPSCPQRIRNTGREDLIFLAVCTPRFLDPAYEDLNDTLTA